jgi:hypothetical protein
LSPDTATGAYTKSEYIGIQSGVNASVDLYRDGFGATTVNVVATRRRRKGTATVFTCTLVTIILHLPN